MKNGVSFETDFAGTTIGCRRRVLPKVHKLMKFDEEREVVVEGGRFENGKGRRKRASVGY